MHVMSASSKVLDGSMVYAITPETPFPTPSSEVRAHREYKIGSVIDLKESRTVELKTGGGNYPIAILPSHVKKYGSAFLNSGGGKLLIGITDDGVVSGIRLTRNEDKERVRKVVKDEFLKFTPKVTEEFYQMSFVPCNRLHYYVLEIHIREGKKDEIYADGENKMYYKRDGSVEGPLWPNRIKEIVTKKFLEGLKEGHTPS